MAVYFKFKSAKTYDSIAVNGSFISVAALKRKIYEFNYKSKKKVDSNGLCFGTDFDILVMNAHTGDYYDNDNTLIPIHTSVLIRRVPGTRRRKPIDTATIILPGCNIPTSSTSSSCSASVSVKSSYCSASDSSKSTGAFVLTGVSSSNKDSEYVFEHDDLFGDDIYLNEKPVPPSGPLVCANYNDGLNAKPIQSSKTAEDDEEDKKMMDLVNTPALDRQLQGSNGICRMEKRIPPQGYICHRCQVPGHFIQNCPTNGDPNYDFKKGRRPTGIPEAAFEKEMEALSLKRCTSDFPAELLCPLCKQVMRYAMLTSKCCLTSFCDKCIRDHLILSKLKCVCGATEMLTDYLIPNMTARDTITRILVSSPANCNIGENVKTNSFSIEDMESAPVSQSTTISAAASFEKKRKLVEDAPDSMSKKPKTDISEATSEATTKESAAAAIVEAGEKKMVQQMVVSGETGKRKRKRKNSQDVETQDYLMHTGYYPYRPYWGGMQMGIVKYSTPQYSAGAMSYGLGPFGMPFNGVMPQASFS